MIDTICLTEGLVGRARRTAVAATVVVGTRPVFQPFVPLPVRRAVLDGLGRALQRPPRGTVVEQVDLGGVPTWRISPSAPTRPGDVLYLHGGGYNFGGLGTHGGFAGWLARLARRTVWMPDYRLVPDHPPTAPIEDARRAWDALVERGGVVPALSGDSAGGGLALTLACRLRDDEATPPTCLALHSPWVDAGPGVTARRPSDATLFRSQMRRDAELWVGDRQPDDPAVSPIHGELHGLPSTLVQWGAGESLHEDAERLVVALDAAGVTVVGEAYEGLWHDAMLQMPLLPEATRWTERTVRFLDDHLPRG